MFEIVCLNHDTSKGIKELLQEGTLHAEQEADVTFYCE